MFGFTLKHAWRGHVGSLRIAVIIASLGALAVSCSSPKKPPSLPQTEMQGRYAARVDLVELVIDDPERAAKVRSM